MSMTATAASNTQNSLQRRRRASIHAAIAVSGTSTTEVPSAVTTFATSVSHAVRSLSTTSIACESPGVGPASPVTISA